MNTATAAVVGTSPEVLQHYLTAGIEIEVTDNVPYFRKGERGQFVGLNMQQSPNKVGLLVENKGAYWVWPGDCLPVLRDFSQLTVPLPTGEVPIQRVIELELNLVCDPARHIKLGSATEAIFFNEHGEAWKVLYWANWLAVGNMKLATADYLRSKHFAVGLDPHQFIEAAPSTPTREADNTATTIL